MKKVLIMVAVAALATSAFAQDSVYSMNVVGVQKVNSANGGGYSLHAMPFEADNYDINAVVATQLTAGATYLAGDKINIWDAANQEYKIYYFRNSSKQGIVNKWVAATNENAVATDGLVPPGSGFWIQSDVVSEQEVTLVGDVVNDAAVTNSIVTGYNLVAYPFSTDRAINEMQITNGTAGATFLASDKLIRWDADSQTFISYYFRNSSKQGIVNKWVRADDENTITTDEVASGEGFWYQALNPSEWKANRPYTLD